MFRDESSKVMQKAHWQWGVPDASEPGGPCGFSPASTPASSTARSLSSSEAEAATTRIVAPAARGLKASKPSRLIMEICASPVEKAVQVYIEHYVISLPDEPTDGQELLEMKWVHSHETRDIMHGGLR
ncbi:09059da5-dc3a-4f03-84c2-eebc443a451a [Thermothielavioides terrestris]|uniref:09059da5-dc3a-4f03-84c2-eebc443a451a n=1 Tax=Thermothielavioides terrestris TaxID=2587410 RepID=A0A446BK80_9PEZI|nr:09059da5-dc3a-4f03-84c2-eebc443a451a [Thermothielavioides terrestris]